MAIPVENMGAIDAASKCACKTTIVVIHDTFARLFFFTRYMFGDSNLTDFQGTPSPVCEFL